MSKPYPAAEPFRTQIVGLSISCSTVGGVLRRSMVVLTGAFGSRMPRLPPFSSRRRSRPAQKARPVPVSTMTLTSASSRARSNSSEMLSSIGREIVFIRSGRLRVMVAT